MFVIPQEVRTWLNSVFATANRSASGHLSRVPNVHEPSLDTTLISSINPHARPVTFPAEWLVRIDTHFLGGGRHWGRWEIADIGVLVMFRHRGNRIVVDHARKDAERLHAEATSDKPKGKSGKP